MKPILRRGLVLRLKNGMCVVLLKEVGMYGWNCLSLDDKGPHAAQDITIFCEDLKEGRVLLNTFDTMRQGVDIEDRGISYAERKKVDE